VSPIHPLGLFRVQKDSSALRRKYKWSLAISPGFEPHRAEQMAAGPGRERDKNMQHGCVCSLTMNDVTAGLARRSLHINLALQVTEDSQRSRGGVFPMVQVLVQNLQGA
jgi:hypothetical protein